MNVVTTLDPIFEPVKGLSMTEWQSRQKRKNKTYQVAETGGKESLAMPSDLPNVPGSERKQEGANEESSIEEGRIIEAKRAQKMDAVGTVNNCTLMPTDMIAISTNQFQTSVTQRTDTRNQTKKRCNGPTIEAEKRFVGANPKEKKRHHGEDKQRGKVDIVTKDDARKQNNVHMQKSRDTKLKSSSHEKRRNQKQRMVQKHINLVAGNFVVDDAITENEVEISKTVNMTDSETQNYDDINECLENAVVDRDPKTAASPRILLI